MYFSFYLLHQRRSMCYCSYHDDEVKKYRKSQYNVWPPSAPFHSLNRDFTLNRDFLK